ncbi:MAG TPA: EamA family transporter [Bryobacteraceae bacterium]|nr:EamA family transporter [Bryobacteraceae bacterium]
MLGRRRPGWYSGNLLHHPQFKAYSALLAVCIFWGTTYLGIRMALETFPPILLVGVRFLASGSILLVAAWIGGAHIPRGRELWVSVFTGIVGLGGGNGCLTFAELSIPSGLAALLITTSPFWMVGIEAVMPGGERLHRPTIIGMLVGLSGAALLFSPGITSAGAGSAAIYGFLLLQFGNACWAYAAIYQRRQQAKAHPVVTGAIQQLAAGLAFMMVTAVIPEHPVQWSLRGVAVLVYLIVFGSIVGYSAYIYALMRLPVAIVSIYPYVNPIVAVALGWLFYREPFGALEAVAMLVIFAGVTIVKRFTPQGDPHANLAKQQGSA